MDSNILLSAITLKSVDLKKISQKKSNLPRIIIYLFSWFSTFFHRLSNQQSQKILPISSNFEEKAHSNKFIKFINHLILIHRTIKLLRNRTKYKTLKNVRENVLEVLGDNTYFQKNMPKNSFSFIKNKLFRNIVMKIKKFYRRNFEFFSILLGKALLINSLIIIY